MRFGQLYKIRLAERAAAKDKRSQGRKPSRSGVTSEFGIEQAYLNRNRFHRERIEALAPQKA